MTTYNIIGYGITDQNGKAHLEYDMNDQPLTHSYTGTGAGLIDLVASLDDEITESSIVSRPHELVDGTFADRATTGNKNNRWNNPSSAVQVTTDNTGTTLTNNTGTYHYWANNYGQFSDPFAIELDILDYDDNTNGSIRISGTNSHMIVYKTIGCPTSCHLKITYDGTTIGYQINDNEPVDFVTPTDTAFYIGFRFVGAFSIKYKNFVIYPL